MHAPPDCAASWKENNLHIGHHIHCSGVMPISLPLDNTERERRRCARAKGDYANGDYAEDQLSKVVALDAHTSGKVIMSIVRPGCLVFPAGSAFGGGSLLTPLEGPRTAPAAAGRAPAAVGRAALEGAGSSSSSLENAACCFSSRCLFCKCT